MSQENNETVLKPKILVFGVGGAGSNAVSNMLSYDLKGVTFVVANTDAQALNHSPVAHKLQLGLRVTKGLGAGASPELGASAAEESVKEIRDYLEGANLVFITAGLGGGTGTGASPIIAKVAKELGILTVAVVTKPFLFEGAHRMAIAENGLDELRKYIDTLIIIGNQNLFRIANENTTFLDAFKMADKVLGDGVRGIVDLIIIEGLVNLDLADIATIMRDGGDAVMGTGMASSDEDDQRAIAAAEKAIANPLLDKSSISGAKRVLINVTGGMDMTLFEVDAAANRIREEIANTDANIIFGSTFKQELDGSIIVSIFATGIDGPLTSSKLAANKLKPANQTRNSSNPGNKNMINSDVFEFAYNPPSEKNIEPAQDKKDLNIIRPSKDAAKDNSSDIYEIPAFLRKHHKK